MIDGYKMYIGGAGAILVGVGHLMYDYYTGVYQPVEHYLGWIILGWTIIGGKSALNKIIKK